MKRKLSVFTILLLIFSICGCKLNHVLPEKDVVQNNDEHVITVLLNESSSARVIKNPSIISIENNYYKIIVTYDGNAKTYHFEKNDSIEIPVKNGLNKFEVAAYKERTETDAGYTYSTPLLYSNSSITIDSETESISLTVSPIIKTYTQGELVGVADEGTVSFTVIMPSQAENSEKLKLISINGLPKTIAYTFKDEDKSSSIVHTTDTKAAPGVYNCSIIVQTTDNQNFLYSQTVYCAMNLITPVLLDFSNESFSTESCGEIGYINFYDSNNSGTNLISFDEDTQNYTCYGIDRTNTYYLELTMKVAGQKIDVSIKKDGDTDFGSPLIINNLSGYEISFVDSNPAENNNYIQQLKYPFGSHQDYWIGQTGGSEVKISVSKGGTSKDYIIKLSPEVPVVPEDVEVSHPVDVSGMTALPVHFTELTETNYVITNEAQLFELGTYVNDGGETTGKTFVLGENIALTSEWVPIGYDTNYPFMGTFDGNNYKISNLSITTNNSTHGFIGSMKSGTILNLTVDGSINVSDDYVAGICAYVSGNSKINNCINNVIINGREYCGGISAYYDGDSFEITNCVNFGSVTGHEYCSGFIGRIGVAGTSIINCVNLADVTSDYSVAGIVLTRNSTVIENSYNAGIISGTSCESPISYGITDASLKDCYYLKDCTYESGVLFVRNALGSAANPDAEDVSSFTHSSSDGKCTLTKTVNSKTDLLQALNSYSGIDSSYNKWVYSQNSSYKGLPVFKDTMARLSVVPEKDLYSLPIKSSLSEYYSTNSITPPNDNGVYSISNLTELQILQAWNSLSSISKATFVLLDDIDLGEVDNWTPIGQTKNFNATFDGNGHRIYNLKVNTDIDNAGLFGKGAGNTCIKNLIVEGSVTGLSNCGGIIGNLSGSTSCIQNCISNVTVTSSQISSGVGGIVGSLSSATVINCVNLNTVSNTAITGNSNIGGIVGNNTGKIYNCVNLGTVSGWQYVGGINGYGSGSLTNCYTAGEIQTTNPSTNTIGIIDGTGSGTMDSIYYFSDQTYEPLGSSKKTDATRLNEKSMIGSTMNEYIETYPSINITINSVVQTLTLNKWSYTYNGFPVCVDCSKVTNP